MAQDTAENPLIGLRAMTLDDLDAVVDNELRAYEFPWTRGIFADCLSAGHECRVLCLDARSGLDHGALIGHGVLSAGAGEAHLLNVCVRRDMQGRGYGRRLVVHMLQRAVGRGAGRLFLEVRLSNVVAATLYESLGFREVGIRRDYYPAHLGHEDARVMAIDLEGRFSDNPV
jgi:ribosomal-protein-alanine N-acetyltransferase